MNDDSTEKRMAGDYEIIQAVQIGDREVVLGENPQDETGMKYMCAFCRQNALFAEYSEVMASDDFPEIVELFGQRIAEQAQKTHIELNKPRIQGIDDHPITAEGCIPISHEDDLHGKIVVIKPEGGAAPGIPQGYPPAQALSGRLWGFSTQPGVRLLLR